MKSLKLVLFIALLFGAGSASAAKIIWSERQADGSNDIQLYVFWSETCPHCEVAVPFFKDMDKKHPWLNVQLKEVTQTPKNMELYRAMAAAIGEDSKHVPAFLWCGTMYSGYGDNEITGQWIMDEIDNCRGNPQDYQNKFGKK